MLSWLEQEITSARASRAAYVPGERLNRLQKLVVEDGRLLLRLEPRVLVVETAHVRGDATRVCFALHDGRSGRCVAVDLTPESLTERLSSHRRVQAILGGGDVDAFISFRGKDIVHNVADCVCLLARLEHDLFSEVGYEQARTMANPTSRRYELNRNGVSYVPVPWTTDDGEEHRRWIRVLRKVRRFPRPRLVS